ncbi:hypothetical protein VTH82DRAFT_1593 [Thermothelomyces myriococcoides]
MKFCTAVSFLVALATSALASPAPVVTPAPRAPADEPECPEYKTTTSYRHAFCPAVCVEPDSPKCPPVACPAVIISCKPDETITRPPLPAPTSVTATVTQDCVVTHRGRGRLRALRLPRLPHVRARQAHSGALRKRGDACMQCDDGWGA